jgi:hypothetical protein
MTFVVGRRRAETTAGEAVEPGADNEPNDG